MYDHFLKTPDSGSGYTDIDMSHVVDGYMSAYKKIGYTPLQVLEEIRSSVGHVGPMTYVGRLDPMAEGWFDILFNGDMDLKNTLMQKDKTYEVKVLFGASTDTGDVLGKIQKVEIKNIDRELLEKTIPQFIGKFTWEYPTYSSPMLSRTSNNADVVREKEIQIYKLELVDVKDINSEDLLMRIKTDLDACVMPGDFRIKEILKLWKKELEEKKVVFSIVTVTVSCSSGTYMRTLAEKLGNALNVPALALHIKRISH